MTICSILRNAFARLAGFVCWAVMIVCAHAAGQEPKTPPTRSFAPELLKLIPDALTYDRRPLPEGENAFPLLQKACARMVTTYEFERDFDRWRAFERLLDWDEPYPGGHTAERLDEFSKANAAAVALMEEALTRPRLQLPRELRDGDKKLNEAIWFGSAWTELSKVRRLRARQLWERGQHAEAAQELIATLRFGGLLLRSDALPAHQMFGRSIQSNATGHIVRLCSRATVPDAIIESLLTVLSNTTVPAEGTADGLRQDFWSTFLPELADLPERDGLEAVLNAIIDKRRPGNDIPKVGPKLDAQKARILALLRGHPAPFDRAETVRLAAQSYAAVVENLGRPWPQQQSDPTAKACAEASAWPMGLSLGNLELGALYLGHDPVGVTDEALAAAREQLRTVHNPLGKHVAGVRLYLTQPGPKWVILRDTARVDVARCILAIRLHERRQGGAPKTLDSLVITRLLPAVPVDPFDGRPIRYDRERRILWSVGPDGRDDGGREPGFEAGREFLFLFRQTRASEVPQLAGPPAPGDLVWDVPKSR